MTIELFKIKNKYKLPNKYKGKKTKNGGLTINDPRKWTKKEIEWLLMLQEKNLTLKQIAQCLDRDVVSVSIKSKRLKKENGKTYNEKHRYSKYLSNEDFIKIVKPKSVLDLYSGKESYYNDKVDLVVANDINKKYKLDTNLDSLKCLCKHYYKNNKFDLVDLDPFGSAYDCFDLAIKIAKSLDRELVSVQIKIKRLKKETGKTYNEKHRQDKYNTNNMFLDKVNVKSVLDVFAGEKSFYKNKCDTLVTNDKEKNYRCNYNMDSFKLLCKLYSENKSFDLIDLDPFGSAYDCFDIAIKMSKKAIIITFGELGHLRWKRLDFVKQRYNINNLENFKIEKMIEKVIKIGKRNKKKLNPIFIKKWTNIGRVYFKVD